MVRGSDPLPPVPPQMMPDRSPAANAVRHGMTATRYVSPEQEARRRAIHDELVSIFAPDTREEMHCVDQLALARAQLYDVEAAAWQRFEWEKAHARERFDRRMRDQLDKDLAAWRSNPFLWLDVLAHTWLGACHLEHVWAEVADTLASSDSACSLERIFDAMAATKSPFGVEEVCLDGIWIINRHLATTPDPEAETRRWLTLTCKEPGGPRFDQEARARRILKLAPDSAVARHELIEKAVAERDRWALRANELRSRYETDRELSASRAVGFVPSDEKATHESKLALRYLTSARNRVEKFERRLDALLKLRPVRKIRQGRDFNEMRPTPMRATMTDAETARLLAEIEAMEAGNAALDAEIAELEARQAAMEREIEAIQAEYADEPTEAASEGALVRPELVAAQMDKGGDPAIAGGLRSESLADANRRSRRPDPRTICDEYRKKEKRRMR